MNKISNKKRIGVTILAIMVAFAMIVPSIGLVAGAATPKTSKVKLTYNTKLNSTVERYGTKPAGTKTDSYKGDVTLKLPSKKYKVNKKTYTFTPYGTLKFARNGSIQTVPGTYKDGEAYYKDICKDSLKYTYALSVAKPSIKGYKAPLVKKSYKKCAYKAGAIRNRFFSRNRDADFISHNETSTQWVISKANISVKKTKKQIIVKYNFPVNKEQTIMSEVIDSNDSSKCLRKYKTKVLQSDRETITLIYNKK